MNWYKLASHPLAEKLTAQWSSRLFKKLLEDFYWTRQRAKEPNTDIDPNYFFTGFVPEKNPFNISHISVKMEAEDRDDIEMDGRTTINKGRYNDKKLMNEYPGKTIFLSIGVPINFDKKYFSELSYRIKQSLRHELEHTSPSQESRLEDTLSLVTDTETEMGLRRRLGYLLNPIEIEAFTSSLYYSAKKSRQPFISVLDNYLSIIKNNIYTIYKKQKPYDLIENVFVEVKKKWLDYASKRYPNILKT